MVGEGERLHQPEALHERGKRDSSPDRKAQQNYSNNYNSVNNTYDYNNNHNLNNNNNDNYYYY